MKKAFVGAAALVILGTLALGIVASTGWHSLTQAVDPGANEPKLVRVEEGDSAARVAAELEEKGLIRSAFWFRVVVRLSGATLDVGLYHLQSNESALQILATLASGDVAEVQVTFPEGWRIEEIADRLVSYGVITDRASLATASSQTSTYPTLVKRLNLSGDESAEGFLFPDTYRFDIGATPDAVVSRMVENFLTRTANLALTYDTVTLAAIVEREARHAEDRAAIAGVYANRLALGMGLEADPTVQYSKANRDHAACLIDVSSRKEECGLVDWWPTITVADYRSVDSPFNTYLHAGLLPAPIANPGLASLEAAAKAAEHDYLYFVTDANGKAHFATTLAEHQANKVKYLR